VAQENSFGGCEAASPLKGAVLETGRAAHFGPDREVCEYCQIAGQEVLPTPHCCLPHTVCNLVMSFSSRESAPARV